MYDMPSPPVTEPGAMAPIEESMPAMPAIEEPRLMASQAPVTEPMSAIYPPPPPSTPSMPAVEEEYEQGPGPGPEETSESMVSPYTFSSKLPGES